MITELLYQKWLANIFHELTTDMIEKNAGYKLNKCSSAGQGSLGSLFQAFRQ